MLKHPSNEVELGRRRSGQMATPPGGLDGAFEVRCPVTGAALKIIASTGDGWAELGFPDPPWEHVSVSTKDRCPTWPEMCWVKDQFFGPDEVVIQFHPKKEDYVNYHPFTLHMWKPVGVKLPTPPPITVGPHTSAGPKVLASFL